MMKNNYVKKLLCAMLAAVLFAMPVQAAQGIMKNGTVESGMKMELPSNKEHYSVDTIDGEGRGSIISTGTVVISNRGGGEVGIIIETLAHKQCDEIRHVAILERRNDDGKWSEVSRYEYVAEQKNFPTEELTGMTNSISVKNQTVGKYYRVRGIHSVWKDGKSETFSSETNGILITKYGD